MDVILCILNILWGLVIAFGGLLYKRMQHEADHSRAKISELYGKVSKMEVEAAEAKAENATKFVNMDFLKEFKTEIFDRFKAFEEKMEKLSDRQINARESK